MLFFGNLQDGVNSAVTAGASSGVDLFASLLQLDGSVKKYAVMEVIYHKGDVETAPAVVSIAPSIELKLGAEI